MSTKAVVGGVGVVSGEERCICLAIPSAGSLDGRDGWVFVDRDCRSHGANHFDNRIPIAAPAPADQGGQS